MDPSKRERILWNIGDLLLTSIATNWRRIISSENGKTVREAAGADVAPAADCFRYYAGWVRKIYGETIPVDGPYLELHAARAGGRGRARSCRGIFRCRSRRGRWRRRWRAAARWC